MNLLLWRAMSGLDILRRNYSETKEYRFWFFWHMPKCGGTSFVHALSNSLKVTRDYHPVDRSGDAYRQYVKSPCKLSEFSRTDCLVGHYNIKGIQLWQRYPDLFQFSPRVFTILRDPVDTAVSGVRYGMQNGRISSGASQDSLDSLFLRRSNYFSSVLGISKSSEITMLQNLLWKSCDISNASKLISEINSHLYDSKSSPIDSDSVQENAIPRSNVTRSEFLYKPSGDALKEFKVRASLDLEIYRRLAS